MLPINLYDTIRVRLTPDPHMRLDCRVVDPVRPAADAHGKPVLSTVELPPTEENLVYRAMQMVARNLPSEGGLQASLVKRIPSSAGLGGASSDAAALLVAARHLIRRGPAGMNWSEWGAALGSDVPFFLMGQAGWCRGRGEIVDPIFDLPRLDFVVVKPPVGLATPEVYRHVDVPSEPRRGELLIRRLRERNLHQAGRLLFNRLTEAAGCLTPWIKRIRTLFQRTDVLGHEMSGSGTSYFGLCHNAKHAVRIAAQLRSQRLGTVLVARSIQRPGGDSP